VLVTDLGRLIPLPRSQYVESGSLDESPLDKWCAIEDLWLRLASCSTVSMMSYADGCGLALAVSNASDTELVAMAADAEFYRWRCAGATGSFLRHCEQQGEELRCWLTTSRVMVGWPQGDELIWQVKGFLLRTGRMRAGAGRP
jgi:hypothetical protein